MKKISALIFCGVTTLVTVYLGYHSVYGRRGLQVKEQKIKELVAVTTQWEQLQQEKDSLSNKVSLIHRKIDKDLLEQLAWNLFRCFPETHKVLFTETV